MTTSEYGGCPHFLEGTGSLVLDRRNQVAFVVISERSHEVAVRDWKLHMTEFDVIMFHAYSKDGTIINHTNKVLFVGQTFAVLCSDSIADPKEKK